MPDVYDFNSPDIAWVEGFLLTSKAKKKVDENEATVECPECGAKNPAGTVECEECGADLSEIEEKSCGCRQTLRISAKACHNCGRNFHKGGKGGGGGGSSPTKTGLLAPTGTYTHEVPSTMGKLSPSLTNQAADTFEKGDRHAISMIGQRREFDRIARESGLHPLQVAYHGRAEQFRRRPLNQINTAEHRDSVLKRIEETYEKVRARPLDRDLQAEYGFLPEKKES